MSSAEPLTLLYRGPLKSCNYGCDYCPFAKQTAAAAELEEDRRALERLVGWVSARGRGTSVLFTPWGEALIHPHYQQALATLSGLSHVGRVAIQTNLSAPLRWLDACQPERLGIWATYHPGHASRPRFLESCLELHRRGVSFSVGVVGLREHLDPIEALRRELPPEVYLWVNAFKRGGPGYYRPGELERLRAVDPLVDLNLRPQPSRGRACRAGHTVVAVAGDGAVRRCPFTDEAQGSLDGGITLHASPQPCPEAECRCHLGYVHLVHLGLHERFGAGLLERALPRSV
jgi:hypothetical protein